jgi:acetyltransferase
VSAMMQTQPSLVGALRLPSGECAALRPIGPRDAGILQAHIRGLSPQSRYDRFFGALYELPPVELDRLIHLDQKCQLALLAEIRIDGAPIVVGEARIALASERLEGEFALSIADDWHHKGLGTLLIADIVRRVRSLGARCLVGDILRSNEPMKALARKMGFLLGDVPRDTRLVRILKDLMSSQAARPCETLTTSFFGGRSVISCDRFQPPIFLKTRPPTLHDHVMRTQPH